MRQRHRAGEKTFVDFSGKRPHIVDPKSANAINKDVGVHTKVSLNVRHRVVSPARIAERTASLEIRLKL